MDCSGIPWAALGYCGLLWTVLGCSGLLWAAAGRSGLVWAAQGCFCAFASEFNDSGRSSPQALPRIPHTIDFVKIPGSTPLRPESRILDTLCQALARVAALRQHLPRILQNTTKSLQNTRKSHDYNRFGPPPATMH